MSSPHTAQAFHIEATTLATSLGDDLLTSLSAYTALRKNLRYREVDGEKVVTAPARDIAGELHGAQRLNALLQAAWQPMAQVLRARPPAPTLYLLALPAWPVLPGEDQPLQPLVDAFSEQFRQTGLPITAVQGFIGGAETCHTALAQAFQWVNQGVGLKQVVLLAADSLCDPDVLSRDHRAKRIYGRMQSSGWLPGEGAACLLLTPRAGQLALAGDGFLLYPPGLSELPGQSPRWPSEEQGDGQLLSQAMRLALDAAGLQPGQVDYHASDSDGSRWRLEDERAAVDKVLAHASNPSYAEWMPELFQPAELSGQVGAVWGALNWALIEGLHRHELRNFNRVLCTSQDIGGRCGANVMALAAR